MRKRIWNKAFKILIRMGDKFINQIWMYQFILYNIILYEIIKIIIIREIYIIISKK